MLIFVLSFLAVTIVSFCFFKSKFWENRYLVLLIGTGVALVATLVTNYFVRGDLQTKIVTLKTRNLHGFYINDTILVDSTNVISLKDFVWKNHKKHVSVHRDTTITQDSLHILIEYNDYPRIWFLNRDLSIDLLDFNKNYIAQSPNDSLAYRVKYKKIYDVQPNNWITGFTFPRIDTYWCFYIPSKEYALIPGSLKKLPK